MNNELWEILVPASNNKDKKFTFEHYNQEAVLTYRVSNNVILLYKNNKL